MDRVAIVGVGQTKHEARKKEYSFSEMVYGAVKMALEDAGIGIDGIDNVITTSNDFWDGRTISSMATGDMSGGPGRNDSCVEGDGTFGAFYGLCRILSGSYGTTLVTAYTKGSKSVSHLITNAAFDPIHMRSLGLDMIPACALQARRYMTRSGIAKPVPYAYGDLQLDGADTAFSYFIEYKDESNLKIGARVEAVFEEERTGTIKDIKHFLLIE